MTRFRSFTAALMLATVLAGATVGLTGASFVIRAAVVGLALGACAIGWSLVSGRRPQWFISFAIVSFGVMGLFSWHLVRSSSPFAMRSLHVAALLAYGVILLAAALRMLRVSEARALLLAFSIAVPLVVADALVTPPTKREPRWQINGFTDPHVWFRYVPNSTGRNYYPDNPRGYFLGTDSPPESWGLEIHEGSQGQLEHGASQPGLMRVSLTTTIEPKSWHVRLQQGPFEIEGGKPYAVRFRARAAAARWISCLVEQTDEPWRLLAPYLELEIHPDWRSFECPFVATAGESNARVSFGLGLSDVPVEFMNVALRDLSTDRDVAPTREFFVSYRLNSLGFRGPDYAIPTPPGIFRILALGDSYTFGVGVHEQDTFAVRLESGLNAAAGVRGQPIRYEVVNGGVSGYSTRDERISYERFSSAYEPQLVLLTMVFNDDLSFGEEVRLGFVPKSAKPGTLSNLLAWIPRVRKQPRTHDYTSAVRELLQLDESCRQRGARLAVVIFRQKTSAPWQQLVEAVNEGVRGTGIPVLDLGPALLRDSPVDLIVHRHDGHPNEVAHRMAAEEIERFLRSEGLLPS